MLKVDLFIGGGGGGFFARDGGGGGGGPFLMLPTAPVSMFDMLALRDPTLPYDVDGESERSLKYRSGLLVSYSSAD